MSETKTNVAEWGETYERLVRRVQDAKGSERQAAFNALIEQFRFAAQSWAFQMLGDLPAAQDAAQEAFIIAYEKLDDLRDPAAFPIWLRRIVRSQCSRDLRQNAKVVPLDERAISGDDTVSVAEEQMRHDRLHLAVRGLPDHERVVTELFYLYGYSQQEIAERLGLPLTTVKKRLQYARERLRETMPIEMRLGNHLPMMRLRAA